MGAGLFFQAGFQLRSIGQRHEANSTVVTFSDTTSTLGIKKPELSKFFSSPCYCCERTLGSQKTY